MTLNVQWTDHKRDPQCAPNPDYPGGIDLDLSNGAEATCSTELRPYPTPRCGHFLVHCTVCLLRLAITTAGRPDDPRSVKIACRLPTKGKQQ